VGVELLEKPGEDGCVASELEDGLARLVRRVDPALGGIAGLARVSAGASLETWRFDAVGADGSCAQPLILRRSPGFRTSQGLTLDEEARLLRRLHGAIPVPGVWRILDTADALGEGFVMERIAGETVPRRILSDPALAAARAVLTPQLAHALAAIHGYGPAELPTLPHRRAEDRLDRLARDVAALDPARPVLELAVRWLRDRMPPEPAPRLVHGDYRNGNIIVDASGLVAVLDWEGAHLGDPAEDLAWLMLPPWRFGRLDLAAGGIGAADEFLDAYAGAPDRERIRWWLAFGSLRWSVACAHMVALVASGRDRSVERMMIARRASESELDLMRLITGRPD
jgi:aminoglycoside phosphotransferase (APT) family kinase protein